MVRAFFAWPNGGIWSNLIASAIWAIPTLLLAARKLRKMHLHIRQLHDHHRIEPK